MATLWVILCDSIDHGVERLHLAVGGVNRFEVLAGSIFEPDSNVELD
jgi:hypothetical protein